LTQNKYFIFGLALALVLAIYLFVPTKQRVTEATTAENKSNYTLANYQSDFYKNQPDSVQAVIREFEEKLAKAEDSASKIIALTESINFYNQIESPEIASLLIFQKAELIKNTNSWKLTGDNFIHLLSDLKVDTALLTNISNYAMMSYEKSIALDSNNLDAKMQLASCYMEMSNQPMNGVQLLLGIVKKDAKNIKAQLLLAKFGLVSGQYEKVMQRLENVLSLQPKNQDALLMRAEAYAQTGKPDLAAKDLKTVSGLSSVPKELKAQLQLAIKDLEMKKVN
jgi:predicted Zn-dependent protease